MAVLVFSVVVGACYSLGMAFVCSKSYFGLLSNKPFTKPWPLKSWPDIDPPLWRVALSHIAGLLSTVLWIVQWPSVTEVGMALCLVPLLFVPFPAMLNNVLEWVLFLIFGNAKGDGSHKDPRTGRPSGNNGAPPIRWPWPPSSIVTGLVEALLAADKPVYAWHRMIWHGRDPDETLSAADAVNCNHALLSYLQNESWDEMHHLDEDVLADFPSSPPSSRTNAVMMARCATMSYDRWRNVDQAVSCRWNKDQQNKYSMLIAWDFDRVTAPSNLEAMDCSTDTATHAPPVVEDDATTSGTTSDVEVQTGIPPSDSVSPMDRLCILRTLLQKLQCSVTKLKTSATQCFLLFWQIIWWWAAGEPGAPGNVFNGDETTAINTDACLLRADKVVDAGTDFDTWTAWMRGILQLHAFQSHPQPVLLDAGKKEVALVLAFRGTEALQTVDWISDFSMVTPPVTAKDPAYFPQGFTHQGFRDSLGLKRNLQGAEDLPGYSSSYLVYKPDTYKVEPVAAGSTSSAGWKMGTVKRVDANKLVRPKSPSPFTIISTTLHQTIERIKLEPGSPNVKLFVTGHSLGGALAHLFFGTLLLAKQATAKQPDGSSIDSPALDFEAVYTFGEPRIGDQVWVENVEDALRAVACGGEYKAEDRFKRVVNTLDIVTRIPPPLGNIYQHPGHCTLIKPHFAIAKGPAGVPGCACHLTKMAEAAGVDTSFSPIIRLTETPEIFLWPAVTAVLVKLAVSVLLLASSIVLRIKECSVAVLYVLVVVAAAFTLVLGALLGLGASIMALMVAGVGLFTFVCLPKLYEAAFEPVLQQAGRCLFMLITSTVQPLNERPRLVSNPIYVVTRLLALMGPGPIVLLLDVLLLPLIAVSPFLWWTVPVEAVLLLLLFAVMPPVIIGGLIDHSMAEYYTACWVSSETDWKSTTDRRTM